MALSAAPGGDAGEGLDLNLNPFKRKRDKPVAYWSGITEVNGEKQFTYPVPDYFNGKIRVMAISVTPSKIGKAQTSATVRDNFIMTPNVPYMVAPGDEFDVSVGVSNNLEGLNGKPVEIAVQLTPPPQLEVVGKAEQSLSLAEKREGVINFRLRAKAALGDAPLVFDARYGDKTSRRTISTSVRPAMPYRTQTVMGRMSSSQNIDNLRQMFDAYAQRSAAVSHSPLVLTNGLAQYLADYPYYCSEQNRQPFHSADHAKPASGNEKQPEPGRSQQTAEKPARRTAFPPERQRGHWCLAFIAGNRSFRHAIRGAISAGSQSGGLCLAGGDAGRCQRRAA